jgi:hypothetical protein
MPTIRNAPNAPKRNERCPCGSGAKYKRCHGALTSRAPAPVGRAIGYIDSGETPVRYVIADGKGTSFFCDKDNKILIFSDRAEAYAVANLEEFSDQEPGEINVAGVGQEKFAHLCETLPYLEVDAVQAVALIRERLAVKQEQLEGTDNGDQNQNQNENQNQENPAGGSQDSNAAEDALDQNRESPESEAGDRQA